MVSQHPPLPGQFTVRALKRTKAAAAQGAASPVRGAILWTMIRSTGTMPNGTVKWFNTTKGYGFIAPEEGGKDVFVHISAVERSGLTGLADNQKVSYELREGRDGRTMASDLKVL
jgi:cold shock protein